MSGISAKKFTKDMISVLFSQTFSIFVSFILGFIVPKFIDEYQYAYWQTFILYYGYVAIANFGMLDGFILRYSQYDYDELNKKVTRSFFRILMLWISFIAIIMVTFTINSFDDEYRSVGLLVSIGIIVKHFWAYNSNIFQITNRMHLYARLTFFQRFVYIGIVIALIFFGVNNFVYYCLAELSGEFVAAVLSIKYNQGLFLGKGISFRDNLKEIKLDISGGILLLIANLAANFIVGGAKMIIQLRWDVLVFGKVSFSFSLTNVFLSFITAISVVLFPSLKRMNTTKLPVLYYKIRTLLSLILFFFLIFYFPLCWILQNWLPQYNDSLLYLGILLPLIVYTAIVTLLTNNYLKAYRKEKDMLIINFFTVFVSLVIFMLSSYLLNSLDFILYGVIFSVILRSFLSEYKVIRIIKGNISKFFLEEILLTIVFIISVQFENLLYGCILYFIAFIFYFIINKRKIFYTLKNIITLIKS